MIGTSLGRILETLRTTGYVSPADIGDVVAGLNTLEAFVSAREGGIDHNQLLNYMEARHVDWGHVNVETLDDDLTLFNNCAIVQALDPGGASRDITLPPENNQNPPLIFYNSADDAENLVCKSDAPATILTIERGQTGILFSDGTSWRGYILYVALDEDDMASDDDAKVATQQSIKKYVDDQIATCEPDVTWGDGLQEAAGTASVDLVASGGLKITGGELEVDDANVDHDALSNFVAAEHYATLDEDDMSSNSATNNASQQSIKAYVDNYIPKGTSFPGTPSDGDLYLRTDLGWLCRYIDADSVWVTEVEFATNYGITLGISSDGASNYIGLFRSDYAIYITRVVATTFVVTTNDGSHYWTVTIRGRDTAYVNTSSFHSFNTSADSPDTFTLHEGTASSDSTPAYCQHVDILFNKTGAPGNLDCEYSVYYKLIVT